MDTVHYSVSGMVNSESKNKLKNSLQKIKGIHETAIDISRGSIEVKFNPPATSSEIEKCIENTGYPIEK